MDDMDTTEDIHGFDPNRDDEVPEELKDDEEELKS